MANGGGKKDKDKEGKKRRKAYRKEHDVKTDECKNVFGKALDKCRAGSQRRKDRRADRRKDRGDKENKFYSAETSAIDAPTYTKETSEQPMDVTHQVIESGKETKSTDYTPDDSAANLAKVKEIGGSVTSEVGSPTAGSEETIQGSGMKSGYVSQQLYKKTKSGELKAKKGVKYEGQSILGGVKSILPSSAAITRRGHETTYESTRGMDRKEIRSARKRAHELDPEDTTRYVSQKKIGRKIERVKRQIDRKAKGQELEAKPVQNFTYATTDTHPYSYATPTDEVVKSFAGSSTRMNRKKNNASKTRSRY